MSTKRQKTYNDFTMLKALEEVDKASAVQVISDPLLDGSELSSLLETSLLGTIVNKESGEPLRLSNEVVMAGFRNKLNQVIDKAQNEYL